MDSLIYDQGFHFHGIRCVRDSLKHPARYPLPDNAACLGCGRRRDMEHRLRAAHGAYPVLT